MLSWCAYSSWCETRLEELISAEEVLPLLEALTALMRTPGAPAWLRGPTATLLSRCVMRPQGVVALLLSLNGRRCEVGDAVRQQFELRQKRLHPRKSR